MKRALILYESMITRAGDPFEPLGCFMHTSRRAALAELKELQKTWPDAHLVKTVKTLWTDRSEKQ
ncbi:MAG: hypothetical protein AB7L09_15510 [Nitrospira sp.]